MSAFLVSGRDPWDNIGSVFSSEFDNLIQNLAQTLGTAIGSAARIVLGIVTVEKDVPKRLTCNWPTYYPALFGRGFVDHLLERFLELIAIKKSMHLAARTSFQEAKIAYENQIKVLTLHCNRYICAQSLNPLRFERFCLVVVVETIILLGYIFTEASVAPNLFPKASAVREKYKLIAHAQSYPTVPSPHSNTKATIDSLTATFGPVAHVLDGICPSGGDHRMEPYITLFTGYSPDTYSNVSAISRNGICFYMGIIVEGSSGDPENVAKCISYLERLSTTKNPSM
ncbi:hypothetical protein GQ44DRAFT_811262 [Phaeosphaeriaceae sp. PMI808]|nr:hypothetical protein GQ44DRAFT_811262 [Phaeosphaeriaceae sp. PMI808]